MHSCSTWLGLEKLQSYIMRALILKIIMEQLLEHKEWTFVDEWEKSLSLKYI